MAGIIKSDDLLLVNRGGTDYKVPASELTYLKACEHEELEEEEEKLPIYSTTLTTPSKCELNCKAGETARGTLAGWTTELTTASTEPPKFYFRVMKNCQPGNNSWTDYVPASEWMEYDGTVQSMGEVSKVEADWKAFYIEDKAVCGDEVQQLRSNWHADVCWPAILTAGEITEVEIGKFTADNVKLSQYTTDNPHKSGWSRWSWWCNEQRMCDETELTNGLVPSQMISFLNGTKVNGETIKAGDVVFAETVYEYTGDSGCTENKPGFAEPYIDRSCTVVVAGEVPPPPMPWDNHDGCVFHVYVERQEDLEWNKTEKLMLNDSPYPSFKAWDKNGNNERQITEIEAEEEVVFITPPDAGWIFNKSNLDCKFKFLELTDVSKATSLKGLFSWCQCFNDDSLSDWDVSNVSDMDFMFSSARDFNQDLSNWCVEKIADEPNNFSGSSALTAANIPFWGTCPGGEDGKREGLRIKRKRTK